MQTNVVKFNGEKNPVKLKSGLVQMKQGSSRREVGIQDDEGRKWPKLSIYVI